MAHVCFVPGLLFWCWPWPLTCLCGVKRKKWISLRDIAITYIYSAKRSILASLHYCHNTLRQDQCTQNSILWPLWCNFMVSTNWSHFLRNVLCYYMAPNWKRVMFLQQKSSVEKSLLTCLFFSEKAIIWAMQWRSGKMFFVTGNVMRCAGKCHWCKTGAHV